MKNYVADTKVARHIETRISSLEVTLTLVHGDAREDGLEETYQFGHLVVHQQGLSSRGRKTKG